jgi:TrkA-N domain
VNFVVAGFGKFGHMAVKRLRNAYPKAEIVVLEQDASRMQDVQTQARVILGDAAAIIADESALEPDDVIVPMVPFNLAAEYVLRKRCCTRKTPLPERITTLVPNPMVLNRFTLVCSKADFVCPDDCPEGPLCTVSGQPRVPLCDDIRRIQLPDYRILVQESLQILPGVGGYSFESLRELANCVDRGRYVIATSCKCHAILTCLEG